MQLGFPQVWGVWGLSVVRLGLTLLALRSLGRSFSARGRSVLQKSNPTWKMPKVAFLAHHPFLSRPPHHSRLLWAETASIWSICSRGLRLRRHYYTACTPCPRFGPLKPTGSGLAQTERFFSPTSNSPSINPSFTRDEDC
jgi:hypothetical protein